MLRPFGPYGPGDDSDPLVPSVVRALLGSGPVTVTSGDQVRDYAYVDDQAEALLLAATCPLPLPVAVYDVGSGTTLTVRALVEAVGAAVGGTARERVVFGALAKRKGETSHMCGRIYAIRRDLGWARRAGLEEGLARTVAWHRARTAAAR